MRTNSSNINCRAQRWNQNIHRCRRRERRGKDWDRDRDEYGNKCGKGAQWKYQVVDFRGKDCKCIGNTEHTAHYCTHDNRLLTITFSPSPFEHSIRPLRALFIISHILILGLLCHSCFYRVFVPFVLPRVHFLPARGLFFILIAPTAALVSQLQRQPHTISHF